MAKPFIPPVDQINNLQPKRSKKTFADDTGQGSSVLRQAKSLIRDSYAPDMFEQVGQLNAVVLEVIEGAPDRRAWKNSLTAYAHYIDKKLPDFIEVRFRVPELHAHLPSPKNSTDYAAINLHPIAIMIIDDCKPEVGDIVQIDFADKNNFRGAIVTKPINSTQGPNTADECSPAETHNSAPPNMNLAPPAGDSQTTPANAFTPKPSPAKNAETHGIKYGGNLEYSDTNMFMISKNNYENMLVFNSPPKASEHLMSKNVYSVCIEVAVNDSLMMDIYKMKKLTESLLKNNISVNFYVSTTSDYAMKAIRHLAKITKTNKARGVFFHPLGEYSAEDVAPINEALYNFSKAAKLTYGVFLTGDSGSENAFINPSEDLPPDYIFVSANHYDYSKKRNGDNTRYDSSFPLNSEILPLYHLGGINLVKTPNDPCIAGERTLEMLFGASAMLSRFGAEDSRSLNFAESQAMAETQQAAVGEFLGGFQRYSFDNFDALHMDIANKIAEKTGFDSELDDPNGFLASKTGAQKPTPPVTDESQAPEADAIAPPTFNSTTSDSQTPTPVNPPSYASAPGSQCSPVGGEGAGGVPEGALSVPPDPSYRFDSIPDYDNKLWTVDPGKFVNDQIVHFMDQLAIAVYRRVPMSDIAVAGSAFKKIRVTSTLRTPETQVRLMWDKIDHGGRSAITSLYGSSGWPMEVMDAYYQGKNWDAAVDAVKRNIAYKISIGKGFGHGFGTAVDIHTWSHLDAEGISSKNATKSTLMRSRYVQAVVAAAKELGAKPVVEAYQQHIHITFYPTTEAPPAIEPPDPETIRYEYIWSTFDPVLTWTRRPVGGGITQYYYFTEDVLEDFEAFITLNWDEMDMDVWEERWIEFPDPGWWDDPSWWDIKFTWPPFNEEGEFRGLST